MKRIVSILVIVAGLLGLAELGWAQATAKPLRPFTFILDFLPYGEYTPYFTALEKGWYKEEGLDVRILRGAGSGDTVKRIAAGQGDAGSADFSPVVAARANEDTKVKSIAVYFRETWLSIFVRTDSGINSPKDLEGKTISTTPGNPHQVLWPLYAQLAGLNGDSVKWVTMDGAAMGPALITKRVDAAPFAHVHEARLQKQAKEQGASLKRFAYKDVGMDLYALTVIAREETIARDGAALKAFLRATIRGMEYAWDPKNIEEGARFVVKRNPEVDLDAALGAAHVATLYGLTDDIKTGKAAPGQFDSAKVRKSIDVYTQYLKLKRKVEAEEVYTNDLLPVKR